MKFFKVCVFLFSIFLISFIDNSNKSNFSVISSTNYSEQIASILYTNCTGCHHSGGIAPMSLMNYQEAFNFRNIIQGAVLSGDMPPWPPDTNYSRFRHERILSPQEISLINDWVNTGATQGDSTIAPPAPNYNSTTSPLGEPDLTLSAPVYNSNAFLDDDYVCFTIPSQLIVDKKIRAVEVTPGNPGIVHHCLVYIDPTGNSSIGIENNCMGPSNGVLVGEFAPGSLPITYPGDNNMAFGMEFPANSNVILAMHYPYGSLGMIDSTKVHFYFYPDQLNLFREITIDPIIQDFGFCIPPNQTKTVDASYQFPISSPSLSIFGVFPHMHLIGKTIHSYGLSLNGDTTKFVNIPNWDFEWQGAYHFRKMKQISPGTMIKASAYYDNTSANLHNPNIPPQTICAGFNTTDEMFVIYYLYTPYLSGDENLNLDSLTQIGLSQIPTTEKLTTKIFPNPVNKFFTVQSNWLSKDIDKIELYNINGQLIFYENYSLNDSNPFEKSFDVSKISSIKKSNVYLLRIYNKSHEVQNAKLVTN